jgi:hypothetical protein
MTSSPGHRHDKTKIDEGKTSREAARCLKRGLADHLRRVMINGERRAREDTWGRLCDPALLTRP